MNTPLSVTTLNTQIKSLLETTFVSVYVEGEISNLTYHNSGHIYFSIKDDNSTLSCVMFKGNTKYLKFRLEVGQKIVINGSLTVYTPRGSYQLICSRITPSGVGELTLAYEQLKKRLQEKGFFNSEFKKPLPKYPQKIAIVTSPTGAAIEDMKKIAKHRWPLVKITLIRTLVQGEGAKEDIVRSIIKADSLDVDLIIVGRGGGSIEDLWAFNEEIVANAIFEAKKPIISAVGHESDFVISDFVADARASTPSNAMELALPDITEHRQYVDTIMNEFNRAWSITFRKKTQELEYLKSLYKKNSFINKFELMQLQLNEIKGGFKSRFLHQLSIKSSKLNSLRASYQLNEPKKRDKRGFVQLTKSNKIYDISDLKKGEEFNIESSTLKIDAKVISVSNI